MAKGTINNVKIKGMACAVPDTIVKTTDYYDKFGEDFVRKFTKVVGIEQRHRSDGLITTSDLCYAAAQNLFSELDIAKESIDTLIFVSNTNDYILPATACVLQYRLGLSKECIAFDVGLGCSGYVYGIHMAGSYIQAGVAERVLLLAGETDTMVSPDDKSQGMLYGDGGSATILEKDANAAPVNYLLNTDGSGFRHLIVPCGGTRNKNGDRKRTEREVGIVRSDYDTYMDGPEIFNFTATEVTNSIISFIRHFKISIDDCDLVVFHQANLFMLRHMAKKIKLPLEKMPISIDRYGNTVSASIPITLCDYVRRCNADKKLKLLAVGFGVGLSWGLLYMEIFNNTCLPVITTSEYFDDGILRRQED